MQQSLKINGKLAFTYGVLDFYQEQNASLHSKPIEVRSRQHADRTSPSLYRDLQYQAESVESCFLFAIVHMLEKA
jgi:hypothetical protein